MGAATSTGAHFLPPLATDYEAWFNGLAFNQMEIGLGFKLVSSIKTRFYMRFSFARRETKILNNAVHHGGFISIKSANPDELTPR